jgi:pyruvate/2-oxoglutarate/acetoin dehydrogenase E1 component
MTTVLDSLQAGLRASLAESEQVVFLGEDILDPYGGAFKVARGLSSAFPERVLTTPVSEAGIVGLGVGMALRGLRPVVEIMFGDFLTLAADALINHAAKFRWMSNDQVRVPLVVRTPMGGRRGYGPTHSQSLEKHFLGVPGLRTLAACALGDPGELLHAAILNQDDPVLFLEHKALYGLPVLLPGTHGEFRVEQQEQRWPVFRVSLEDTPGPILTFAAYGYMAHLAQQAMRRLAYEHEVFADLVVFTQLSPFVPDLLWTCAGKTRRLLVVEEGTRMLGWGAEVVARAAEALPGTACARVAAADLPIPAAVPLEEAVLPDVDDLIRAALLLAGREPRRVPLG